MPTSIWKDALKDCPHCGRKQCVDYREHVDDKGQCTSIEYRCAACNKSWPVEVKR